MFPLAWLAHFEIDATNPKLDSLRTIDTKGSLLSEIHFWATSKVESVEASSMTTISTGFIVCVQAPSKAWHI
jgi:hypothetical protein